MKKPTPFELFCRYHLGLDRELNYSFANLNTIAREYGVLQESVRVWLDEFGMSPEICSHVDYSIAKAHSQAQILTITASKEDVRQYAASAFREYQAALSRFNPRRFYDGVNWDDIWEDGEGSAD